MRELTLRFLSQFDQAAVTAFQELIARMKSSGVTTALLTDHPSYECHLGICGTDRGDDALSCELLLAPNYPECLAVFVAEHQVAGESCDDDDARWEWIRQRWIDANGPESGLNVVLLDNGMGDMMDLNTGEGPDPSLPFDRWV